MNSFKSSESGTSSNYETAVSIPTVNKSGTIITTERAYEVKVPINDAKNDIVEVFSSTLLEVRKIIEDVNKKKNIQIDDIVLFISSSSLSFFISSVTSPKDFWMSNIFIGYISLSIFIGTSVIFLKNKTQGREQERKISSQLLEKIPDPNKCVKKAKK